MNPISAETTEFILISYDTLEKLEKRLLVSQNLGGRVYWSDVRFAMADLRKKAGNLGFQRLQNLARAAENLLERLEKSQIQCQPQVIGYLFNLCENLRQNFLNLQNTGSEINPEGPLPKGVGLPAAGPVENLVPFQSLPWYRKTLLFRTPDDGRMAMPFDNVLRLESFSPAAQPDSPEAARDSWMPLLDVSDCLPERRVVFRRPPVRVPKAQTRQVIIYATPQGEVGLVVDEVLDICKAKLEVQRPASRVGVHGSMDLQDRITEILDLPALFRRGGPALAAFLANGIPNQKVAG